MEWEYRELRLPSERVVMLDVGRIVAAEDEGFMGEPGTGPKSDILGVRGSCLELASLLRSTRGVVWDEILVWEDEGRDSLYNVEVSEADVDVETVLGDPDRAGYCSYALSRSERVFANANLLSSVPSTVNVGLVMGAEIKPGLLTPPDRVPMGRGDLGAGASRS